MVQTHNMITEVPSQHFVEDLVNLRFETCDIRSRNICANPGLFRMIRNWNFNHEKWAGFT